MTRQDYIFHLDHLRKGVLELIKFDDKQKDLNGSLVAPTTLEMDRAKKTRKMFEDLSVRLYEDAGVSEKVKGEKLLAGEFEQAEITFPDEMAEKVAEKLAKPAKQPKATKSKGGAK